MIILTDAVDLVHLSDYSCSDIIRRGSSMVEKQCWQEGNGGLQPVSSVFGPSPRDEEDRQTDGGKQSKLRRQDRGGQEPS